MHNDRHPSDPFRPIAPPPCRCHVLLARSAHVGVVLRKGPTRWVQLITWNTKRDTFTPGQWFRGRVYERRSDLSPDGAKLVYFASKINRKTVSDPHYTYAWTAVSKPPFFTALALWPKGDCWAGGGLFEDDRTLWLNHAPHAAEPHPDHRPRHLEVIPNPHAHGEDGPILERRRTRDGWERTQTGRYTFRFGSWTTERREIWVKTNQARRATLVMELAEINFSRPGGPYIETFSLQTKSALLPIGVADWADWDHRDRLIVARGGKLLDMTPRRGELQARELADFNDHRPRRVDTPDWATVW